MTRTRSYALALILASLLQIHRAAADGPIRIPARADIGVSAAGGEQDFSMGRSPRMKLKGLTEMALLDFDLSPLGGRPIASAELFVRSDPESIKKEQVRLSLGDVFPLRLIGISTISSPWAEGGGVDGPDPAGKGASYKAAGGESWAWPGSQLHDVIFANGQSIYRRAELKRVGDDGWWKVLVAPELLDKLRTGGGFGLCLSDDSNAPSAQAANNYIFSREQAGSEPYLLVTVGPAAAKAEPLPLLKIAALPPPMSGRGTGQLALRVSGLPAGAAGVTFQVKVAGQLVEPWQIRPGAPFCDMMALTITDLPPDKDVDVEVVARTAQTQSPPAVLKTKTGPEAAVAEKLPAADFLATGVQPPADDKFPVLVLPELVKVDPFGKSLERSEPKAPYGTSIVMPAARGETVACQLLIDASKLNPGPITVSVTDFAGANGARIPAARNVRLFREWYVNTARDPSARPRRGVGAANRAVTTRPAAAPVAPSWQPELAVPLAGPVSIPDARNAIAGQTHQLVWVDLFVPPATPPGDYAATATVAAGAGADQVKRELTLRAKVYSATIPAEMSFSAELNAYDPPAAPGSKSFYDAHRLAHYLRTTINAVPYHQKRLGDPRLRPTLAGAGADIHVADWSEFDRTQGPLLDGSAFADNPRGPVPVAAYYLPLFENWPMPFLENYSASTTPGGVSLLAPASQPDAASPRPDPGWTRSINDKLLALHHLTAPPMEQALSPAYQQAWRNVAGDFRKHFEAKGWTKTVFQCYTNNKYFKAFTMYWSLEEPDCRQDFLAIRFYGQLFADGAKPRSPADKVKVWFRSDISQGESQADDFNGLVQVAYVNSDVFQIPRTIREAMHRAGAEMRVYGVCNFPGTPNVESAAWCLRSYLVGGDGVLPWMAVDPSGRAFTAVDPNGLIVRGDPAGYDGWVASLRVFAMRRGAQDVELLRLFGAKRNYTRDQLGTIVARYLPLEQRFGRRAAATTGPDRQVQLSSDSLIELKAGLLAAME